MKEEDIVQQGTRSADNINPKLETISNQSVELKEAESSTNTLPTRDSLNQKKTKVIEQKELENKTEPEKVKKKKTRSRNKKKIVPDDDKENTNPENNELSGSNKQQPTKAMESTAVGTVVDQEPTAVKSKSKNKKTNGKKKQASAAANRVAHRKPLAEVIDTGLKQGEFSIDYKGLKDAFGESFSLEDRQGPIHFAPLTSKAKIIHEKPLLKFSTSNAESSRTSNKSTPSAKNRHAEIPPPAYMTKERLGKSKKSEKAHFGDNATIEKIKGKKIKLGKKLANTVLDIDAATKEKLIDENKKLLMHEVLIARKKSKSTSTTILDKPVEPIVFVRERKVKKVDKAISDVKETEKTAAQEEYCHPNDIVYSTKTSRLRYERYLDPKVYKEKLKQGVLYKGVIRISKRNRSDAYVTSEGLDADILISGQRDRNRALDGDTVVVELMDLETVWAKKKEAMIQKREQRHSTAAERPPQEEGEDDRSKPKYVGKVVAIPIPNKNLACSGILSLSRHSTAPLTIQQQDMLDQQEITDTSTDAPKNVRLAWFRPVDTRNPVVAIQLNHAPADLLQNEEKYKNLLMVAKITRWPIDSTSPFGTIVRELGHIGNIVAETQAVLEDNGIVEQPFGQKALKGLPTVPWSITQSEIDKRRDLRDVRIFTIDPATAKDLDDAVHILKLAEDEFEVGVHIADVSHFIPQHTALDHEAFDRGTSTYLCDRVIPMLPSLLCEQLCSLNPEVERLAFSVIWKMDGAGNIKNTWFGKSVIKSCAKLAYEDAQSVIEGQGLPKTALVKGYSVSEVEQDIMHLFNISKQMRQRRFANGALSINSIRLSFKLNDLGEPCGVSIYEQKDANRLIEEFMLCANMSVAEKISSHYPKQALLRQHSPPLEKSLNEFIKIAENLGYAFDGSSAASLQASFDAVESEDVRTVLRLLAIKPMQRAKYFCTGSCDTVKYRHYALNVPLYTHFTSPIRRFADIIVHRQLEAALQNKKSCGYKKDAVQKAASHCNDRKEGAKNAQDMNIQLYLYHYLHMIETNTQKPVICSAIITQVLKDAFEILVPEYGLEKRVHMDALPIERFVYDPQRNALAAYWKEGIESNREWDQGRKLDEEYREPSGSQLYYNQEPNADKAAYKIPEELLNDNLIDQTTKMQRFEVLCKLTVRIQVNVERSPPIINIYPVNPFM